MPHTLLEEKKKKGGFQNLDRMARLCCTGGQDNKIRDVYVMESIWYITFRRTISSPIDELKQS